MARRAHHLTEYLGLNEKMLASPALDTNGKTSFLYSSGRYEEVGMDSEIGHRKNSTLLLLHSEENFSAGYVSSPVFQDLLNPD